MHGKLLDLRLDLMSSGECCDTTPSIRDAFAASVPPAVARVNGQMIVAEARSATLPLGGDAWKTSRILLPAELRGRPFRHLLTGADILPTTGGGDEWIFAGQLFESAPIAIATTTATASS